MNIFKFTASSIKTNIIRIILNSNILNDIHLKIIIIKQKIIVSNLFCKKYIFIIHELVHLYPSYINYQNANMVRQFNSYKSYVELQSAF